MKSFFKVKKVEEVLELISRFSPLEAEEVGLEDALGRVLAEDLTAGEDLPEFDRSTMDGFAVRAGDTFGASESLPAFFDVVGEVKMGQQPDFQIGPGQTARIWTGGMLPPGADGVVMIEHSRRVDERTVELTKPTPPYEHVIRRGEDIRAGQSLLPRGRRLRPQDVGLAAALGVGRLRVTRRPVAAVISTGDEVVPVENRPGPGQVRDVNTYTLAGLVESVGARALRLGLAADDPAGLKEKTAQGLSQADLVMVSGGSSVGVRDFTVEVFESFPGSEILFHGCPSVRANPPSWPGPGPKACGDCRAHGFGHDHLPPVHSAAPVHSIGRSRRQAVRRQGFGRFEPQPAFGPRPRRLGAGADRRNAAGADRSSGAG